MQHCGHVLSLSLIQSFDHDVQKVCSGDALAGFKLLKWRGVLGLYLTSFITINNQYLPPQPQVHVTFLRRSTLVMM